MKKIRVLIVEDSPVIRELLRHIVEQDPRLAVAAAVASAEEALNVLGQVSPDVISMDIRLPGMDGFEATRRIMADRPTPIVVVSASVEAEDLKITMNALRAGALSVVEKPSASSSAAYEALAARICNQLAIMSEVAVVRQRPGRLPGIATSSSRATSGAAGTPRPLRRPGTFRLVGLVASTGGPNAVARVLSGMGADFPLPVLLVQHITASFVGGFVQWLDSVVPQRVVVAQGGENPERGTVYVAPGERHLVLSGSRLALESGGLVDGQCPSGTVLLQSIARTLGPSALGVLLTGMGEDGATGLRDIREAGGYTIAEDESTAVVYGMPAAAVRLGAVFESLPLPEIGTRVRELARPGSAG